MFEGHRVAVVVPARNEAAWIGLTVSEMPAFVDDIIVVDDGSEDDTAARACVAQRPVVVLRLERSLGVGGAIVAGYREALLRGAGLVAVMAGDGQMCPDDLPALLTPLSQGLADYTKGDRFRHPDIGHTMPRERFVVGKALSRLTRLATGLAGLDDSQCGYTAITAEALERIDLAAVWPGYGYPNDLLSHLACAGLRVRGVAVRPVYRGERSGLRPRHVVVVLGLLARAAVRRSKKAFIER